jgi:hypothetical protein
MGIRLVKPPKEKFSWTKEILLLEPEEKFKAPAEYAKTIAPLLSRDVKLKAPDREHETDTVSEPDYVIIKRTK